MLDFKVRLLSQLFFLNAQAMMPKLKAQDPGKGKLCSLLSACGLMVPTQCKQSKEVSGWQVSRLKTDNLLRSPSAHMYQLMQTACCFWKQAAHYHLQLQLHTGPVLTGSIGLFTWKQGARKRTVLVWAHSVAAQPEEQEEAWMYVQRAACPVQLEMC